MSFRVELKPGHIETCEIIEMRGGLCVGIRFHARMSADLTEILDACGITTTDYISIFWGHDRSSSRTRFDFALRPPLAGHYALRPDGLLFEIDSDGFYQRMSSLTEPEWQPRRGGNKIWMTFYSQIKAAKVRMFM